MASNEEGARKRRASVKSLLTAIVALAMLATTAEVARADTVVPNSLAATEGNSDNIYPFYIGALPSMRYQQVYEASQFPLGPQLITDIHFRPDATFGKAFSSTLPNIQINLSTTLLPPDGLSPIFSANVGLLDNTIVFARGSLALSSSFTGPAGVPKDFDIMIALTTSFPYNPSLGNLLLDVRNFGGGSPGTSFDAENTTGDSISRVYTGDVNSLTADAADTWGLVTKFTTQPLAAVPEPSSLLLLGSGLAGLAAWRRWQS